MSQVKLYYVLDVVTAFSQYQHCILQNQYQGGFYLVYQYQSALGKHHLLIQNQAYNQTQSQYVVFIHIEVRIRTEYHS